MIYQGLTHEEAVKRFELYGPNEIEEAKKISPLKILLSQFLNFLVIILIIAGIISFFLEKKLRPWLFLPLL